MSLAKNELDGFQYLCGYVVKNLIKKTLKSQILQNRAISNHDCYSRRYMHWWYDQKLINCLLKGGLTEVHNGCLTIFLVADELFRKDTMGNPHKIDVADMVDQLTKKPKVVGIFNNIVDESGVKNFLPELKINLLILILSLYLKVRAFWKTRDITKKAKQLETQKSKGLRKTIKQKSSKRK